MGISVSFVDANWEVKYYAIEHAECGSGAAEQGKQLADTLGEFDIHGSAIRRSISDTCNSAVAATKQGMQRVGGTLRVVTLCDFHRASKAMLVMSGQLRRKRSNERNMAIQSHWKDGVDAIAAVRKQHNLPRNSVIKYNALKEAQKNLGLPEQTGMSLPNTRACYQSPALFHSLTNIDFCLRFGGGFAKEDLALRLSPSMWKRAANMEAMMNLLNIFNKASQAERPNTAHIAWLKLELFKMVSNLDTKVERLVRHWTPSANVGKPWPRESVRLGDEEDMVLMAKRLLAWMEEAKEWVTDDGKKERSTWSAATRLEKAALALDPRLCAADIIKAFGRPFYAECCKEAERLWESIVGNLAKARAGHVSPTRSNTAAAPGDAPVQHLVVPEADWDIMKHRVDELRDKGYIVHREGTQPQPVVEHPEADAIAAQSDEIRPQLTAYLDRPWPAVAWWGQFTYEEGFELKVTEVEDSFQALSTLGGEELDAFRTTTEMIQPRERLAHVNGLKVAKFLYESPSCKFKDVLYFLVRTLIATPCAQACVERMFSATKLAMSNRQVRMGTSVLRARVLWRMNEPEYRTRTLEQAEFDREEEEELERVLEEEHACARRAQKDTSPDDSDDSENE